MAVLDDAERLMAERGFDAATIVSLEREAGLPTPIVEQGSSPQLSSFER